MKTSQRVLRRVLAALLILLVGVTLLLSLRRAYVTSAGRGRVAAAETAVLYAGDEVRTLALPCTLSGYAPGTELRLRLTPDTEPNDCIFFGSVYAPLTVLADGREIFSCGAPGSYPAFLRDPPTQYCSVLLPPPAGSGTGLDLVYRMPACRRTLSVHAPVVGSESEVLRYLFSRYGFPMLCSMFFLTLGPILIGISLFFRGFPVQRRVVMLAGLLMLFAGAWQFGENTLSNYLLKAPMLLYMMDFMGLFLMLIPLVDLSILTLDLEESRVLNALALLLRVSAVFALLLQLFGLVPFHLSLFAFHVLLPLSILLLTVRTLWEAVHGKSRSGRLLFCPLLVLLLSALLELLNYRLHFVSQFSSIFQMGLFVFVFSIGIYSVLSLRNIMDRQLKASSLENELRVQDRTIEAQKERNELLLSHYEEVRQQRHDIRHHLRTLSALLRRGDYEQAQTYLDSVTDTIPDYHPDTLCDNIIVNATLCFYLQKARDSLIRIDADVQVPPENEHISDASLCVIFGNLLENAIEACVRLPVAERRISLAASIIGDMLFISIDNTFDGQLNVKNDLFQSRKRDGSGTGLVSVRSIAQRHSGSASFRVLDKTFRAEVSVRL